MIALNVGLALFVVHDAASKVLLERYPAFELMFFRSLLAMPLVLVFLRVEQGHLHIHTRRFLALTGRGMLSVVAFGCFLQGLSLMPLADTFAIFMSAPLVVAALAGPLLGEPATRRQWTAVLVGFAAVLVMIRPGGAIPLEGALVMLVAVTCFACSSIATRALGRTEGVAVITVFVMGAFVAAGAVVTPFVWVPPAPADLAWMAVIGALAATAMACTIYAYRSAPPGLVAPFQYSSIVWAVAIGYLVWGDVPDATVAGASLVVVASGLYVLRSGSKIEGEAGAG